MLMTDTVLKIVGMLGGMFAGVMIIAYAERDDKLTWLRQMRLRLECPKLTQYLMTKYDALRKDQVS